MLNAIIGAAAAIGHAGPVRKLYENANFVAATASRELESKGLRACTGCGGTGGKAVSYPVMVPSGVGMTTVMGWRSERCMACEGKGRL